MPRGGKRPNSGRPKNSKNRSTQDLMDLVQSHPLTKDFDPLVSLAVLANGQVLETYNAFTNIHTLLSTVSRPTKPIKDAMAICQHMTTVPVLGKDNMISATKELIQYIYPKLRSTELTDPEGKNPFDTLAGAMREAMKHV